MDKTLKKINSKIMKIYHIVIPDYKKIRKNENISEDILNEIKKEERKIKNIYSWATTIGSIAFSSLIVYILRNTEFVTNKSLVLGMNFEFLGILVTIIGTLFLAKGTIKSADQIAVESTGFSKYNKHKAKALIISSTDTSTGLILIYTGIIFQIFKIMVLS